MARDNNKKNPISIPDIKTKRRRALILLSISVVIICAVIAFFILLKSLMFQSNPRFAFRELSVASPGYWTKRMPNLSGILNYRRTPTSFLSISEKSGAICAAFPALRMRGLSEFFPTRCTLILLNALRGPSSTIRAHAGWSMKTASSWSADARSPLR